MITLCTLLHLCTTQITLRAEIPLIFLENQEKEGRDLCSQGTYRCNLTVIRRAQKIKSREWQKTCDRLIIKQLLLAPRVQVPLETLLRQSQDRPLIIQNGLLLNYKILATVSFRQGWMGGGKKTVPFIYCDLIPK